MSGILSPGRYISERGAAGLAGTEVAAVGKSALLVHGDVGYGLLKDELLAGLAAAGVSVTEARHEGYCGEATARRLADRGEAAGCDVVLAVGGGRVLDTGKSAADMLGAPCVLVPTSPSTCSAASAVVVDYTPDGTHIGGRMVRPSVASLVDPEFLARAPDRLLVSGIVDALAKALEVRLGVGRIDGPGAEVVAAVTLSDDLERILMEHAVAAVAAGPEPLDAPVSAEADAGRTPRQLVAEASLLWPGLIGSLAGERARLAAAHAMHNALTVLPGSHVSLHGELIAFGILVQLVLQDRADDALAKTAAWFADLGCPCDLEALGCGAFLTDEATRTQVLERACAMVPMLATFPGIEPARLERAMRTADEVALQAKLVRA